jgi:hypothetical protein
MTLTILWRGIYRAALCAGVAIAICQLPSRVIAIAALLCLLALIPALGRLGGDGR